MKKLFLLVAATFSLTALSQSCPKGCGKITSIEATNNPKVRADRALLVFKFVGPDGKAVKSRMKIIVDKDTIVPVIDKFGTTKITAKPGKHKIKFKVNWWYAVKMDQLNLKAKNTYHIQVKFEAQEIGGSKPKEDE